MEDRDRGRDRDAEQVSMMHEVCNEDASMDELSYRGKPFADSETRGAKNFWCVTSADGGAFCFVLF